ncbi:acyltransferase family protein [Actinoplanes derwentensis]|uniref:Peptidoglycan/LPS O-acetylase OafA/YrhL, contains acyltransferase and SGNH-hydrolase domains n=1 Tax=Actinoplanes derwentensis TaxID=113562 RepID=A0A1H1T3L8_9ACTN|nr:acyltransferase [Actinoplanes derwentensis]GID89925.1 hypothetical protein Ade03nite_88490 [Actinoplanes derwentensis]SDS54832.1 Peptidoglycan/LPS O-acetylase OafA/YrhL, contains acyltransferase and SGNH-hydrolase domains [Actinoplanes derwentensis]
MAPVPGLTGIRGLLALYVVIHHCWLLAFPGYPHNTGPAWLGWLLHGRFAVVAFIVLSGFSLGLAPARNGWRLGGLRRYLGRRARRILPAYWAALTVSAVIAVLVPCLPLSEPPTPRSLLVYGLMLQDVVAAPAPNGAFWSIAVEAGLYLLFPLLLLLRRKAGAVVTLAVVTVPVTVLGPPTAGRYTVELVPLFTLGLLAAGVVHTSDRIRGLPWYGLSALAAAPMLTLIAVRGPEWAVSHYFWLDLAAGPAIAMFLAAVATRRPGRLLNHGPLPFLGGFSYSLYLIHMPIVALTHTLTTGSGPAAFGFTVAVALPLCLLSAHLLATFCEVPFLVRRLPTHPMQRRAPVPGPTAREGGRKTRSVSGRE